MKDYELLNVVFSRLLEMADELELTLVCDDDGWCHFEDKDGSEDT